MSICSCGTHFPRGVAGGASVSKICHTTPDGCHRTRPGVSYGAVADQLAFDSFLRSSIEETDEGVNGAFLGGSRGS